MDTDHNDSDGGDLIVVDDVRQDDDETDDQVRHIPHPFRVRPLVFGTTPPWGSPILFLSAGHWRKFLSLFGQEWWLLSVLISCEKAS